MGEYADMAVDEGIDEYWQYDQGMFEDGNDPPVGFARFRPRRPKLKTCNRCGKTGLHWAETENGWRLHDYIGEHLDEELHVCTPPPGREGT